MLLAMDALQNCSSSAIIIKCLITLITADCKLVKLVKSLKKVINELSHTCPPEIVSPFKIQAYSNDKIYNICKLIIYFSTTEMQLQ